MNHPQPATPTPTLPVAGSTPPPQADRWLTPREVHTEFAIHKVKLCEMRAARTGPPYRQIGRSIHYLRSDVLAYIAEHTIQTTGR
jgi:predicted DNA-binding transcriptional regulator AlpA